MSSIVVRYCAFVEGLDKLGKSYRFAITRVKLRISPEATLYFPEVRFVRVSGCREGEGDASSHTLLLGHENVCDNCTDAV